MDNERLAVAFEQLASQVRNAPIIGQKVVVQAGPGGGSAVGVNISVTGGPGSGVVIGQRISVFSDQNDDLVKELQEAAQLVRSGNAPPSMLKSLARRAAGVLGEAVSSAAASKIIEDITAQLG